MPTEKKEKKPQKTWNSPYLVKLCLFTLPAPWLTTIHPVNRHPEPSFSAEPARTGPRTSLSSPLSFSGSGRFSLLPISEKLPFLTCTTTFHTSLCPFSIVYSNNHQERRPKFTPAVPWEFLGGGGQASLTNTSVFSPRPKPTLFSPNNKHNLLLQANFCFFYVLQKLRKTSKSESFSLKLEMV